MITTSELYKHLRTVPDSVYQTRVLVDQGNGLTEAYGIDVLKSVSIKQALFSGSGPSIGNTYSAQCEVTIVSGTVIAWPRMAAFSVQVRLYSESETEYSEWVTLGIFYTDQRSVETGGDYKFIGYDGMLLMEQSWTDKIDDEDLPEDWPITAQAAVDLLVLAADIEIDSRTVLDDTVPFVGLDTTSTVRDVLSTIAAGMGGNWRITPDGEFYLVPLENAQDGDDIVDIGLSVVEFATGISADGLPAVTGVELTTEAGTVGRSGTSSGYVIKGECEFTDSAITEVTLTNLSGFRYKPFKAKQAYVDPVVEIGDLILIDDSAYQICSAEWTISVSEICANLAANYEQEVDHEFTIVSDSAKALRKSLKSQEDLENRVYSSIEQTETSIMQQVGETYATQDSVSIVQSSIELTKDELTIEMQRIEQSADDQFSEIEYYIRYKDGVVIVGAKNDPSSLRLSNSEIGMYMNEEVMSFWNQDKQRTPTQLEIPYGGSFRIGDFMFQPRTSGNMSLLWVGDEK